MGRTQILEACFPNIFILLKILSSQYPSCKWTPSNQPKFVFFKQRFVLDLVDLSRKHVVVILYSNRFMQIEVLAYSQCIINALWLPITNSPVERQTFFDYFMKTTADLFERSFIIVDVCIQNIHVVKLQSFQGFFHTLICLRLVFIVEFLSGFNAVNILVPTMIYERGMFRFFRQLPNKVYAVPPQQIQAVSKQLIPFLQASSMIF